MRAIARKTLVAAAAAAVVLVGAVAAAFSTPPLPAWQAEVGRDHPLAGVIWRPGSGEKTTAAEVLAQAVAADFVLLGEVHDNPDAHNLQAWVLQGMIANGRRPAVAFEMFDSSTEKAIEVHRRTAPRDADALAAAVDWDNSGWPDFAMYRPIVQAALDAALPVLPANLPRDVVRAMVRGDEIPDNLREMLGAAPALPKTQEAALTKDIRDSHCGHLPEGMIGPMAEVQAARDIVMARALDAGAKEAGTDGAVLIAGNGHTRTDRGSPFHLRSLRPEATILSVAFLEVEPGKDDPAAYGSLYGVEGPPPFDIVWFVPGKNRPDPCEALERRMEKR